MQKNLQAMSSDQEPEARAPTAEALAFGVDRPSGERPRVESPELASEGLELAPGVTMEQHPRGRAWYCRSVEPTVDNMAAEATREGPTRSISTRRSHGPLPVLLRRLDGTETRHAAHLKIGSYVLGAGAEADILIDEPTVSRRHARLELVPEGVLVQDLDSRNGTFYLGQRIREMVVAPGARIRLGNVELCVEPDPEALASEDGPDTYGRLAAVSQSMRQLFSILERLEGSLVNVLIEGESGTGKELIAQAIHENSSVSSGPFVALNCGALAKELVRSELFGHRRGAFTGAIESRIGAFEAANGGTLFLDELGELPLDVQPMLLRALEDRLITRIGENSERPVRVRVIAATNRRLSEQVERREFRQDLYYRLMVVRLHVPPLRERPEDVPLLAESFARAAGARELPQSLLSELSRHDWPGNVRQLRHAVESYLAIGSLPFDTPAARGSLDQALEAFIELARPYQEQKEEFLEAFTRTYLARLLDHTRGNVSAAARLSGMERSYLNKLTKKMGIKD